MSITAWMREDDTFEIRDEYADGLAKNVRSKKFFSPFGIVIKYVVKYSNSMILKQGINTLPQLKKDLYL